VNAKPTVLVVEDEKNTREGLQRALGRRYHVLLAENADRGLALLDEHNVDVVLTDLRLPGMDGLAFARRAMAHGSQPACILLTAYGSIETAVEAMKAGVHDFLTKPLNLDQLEMVLERALRSRRLETENLNLRRQLDKKFGLETLIGSSPAMEELFDLVRQVAPTRATVLLQGESGTGKELVAHAIHRLSPRAANPFVAVHCAALSQNLLESELFGHEKGAFTGAAERRRGRFELAEGGTLFLDEISEVDAATQVKLLRVLEERAFERVGGQETLQADIRLISATNRDLARLVSENKFRQDLYFRLNVVTLTLPPLRERAEDIPLLVRHFAKVYAEENGKTIEEITPEAMNLLASFSWPGNVRELRNAVERMVVMARSNKLTVRDLPPAIRGGAAGAAPAAAASLTAGTLEDVSRQAILAALRAQKDNRTRAARQLGISRRTLHRKLREYGLTGSEPGTPAPATAPSPP
jgi:DNA-binding NtrC family response regulator